MYNIINNVYIYILLTAGIIVVKSAAENKPNWYLPDQS